MRGQRFFVPLDEEPQPPPPSAVGDILERAPAAAAPPAAPSPRPSSTGFPAHRKRTPQSRFTQKRNARDAQVQQGGGDNGATAAQTRNGGAAAADSGMSFEAADRIRIDQENRQKIASMSPKEIEREQQELFSSLDPALIQRLLLRADIGESESSRGPLTPPRRDVDKPASENKKTVSFAEPDKDEAAETTDDGQTAVDAPAVQVTRVDSHRGEPALPAAKDESPPAPHGSLHFPKPPPAPDLDPSDPDFLDNLHDKYFPDLAHDPSKLAWMQPASEDDKTSSYHPSHQSLPASDLRFNFRGELLPPRLARQIPVHQGLHHHGDAPEAAGYTIPELARLSRSSYAPQRCVAYQTLGRILYRLGTGGFGDEHDDDEQVASLSRGLWDVIDETRATEGMVSEAGKSTGHLSARTYAQEAVWNWQRGGGRKRKAQ